MPFPPPDPSLARTPLTTDGRRVELAITDQHLRTLSEVLKPDSIISGRVVERFANGDYLFALRGRQLIASSHLPLQRDSVVRFQVLESGPDNLHLSLLGPTPTDDAATSSADQRLRALGLPVEMLGRTALRIFEEAGAPLDPARLRQAVSSAGEQQGSPAGPANTTAGPDGVLAAHALLARFDLPVTPALLSLAASALRPGLPDAGAALLRAARLVEHSPATALPTDARADGGGDPHPAIVLGSRPGPSPAPATTSIGTPAMLGTSAAARETPSSGQATTTPATQTPAATGPVASDAAAFPGIPDGPRRSSPGAAAASLPTSLPDVVKDGRRAVETALDLAGLRPSRPAAARPEEGQASKPPASVAGAASPTEVREQGTHLPIAPPPDGERPATLLRGLLELAERLDADGRSAVHEQVRELAAETVCKPRSLAEYDLVLPLALGARQEPVPARLAVAERKAGNGSGWFLRVDADLSRLGPVSLRMSDLGSGPVMINIFALPPALALIGADLADLERDLADLDIDCAVRLTELHAEGTDDA